MHHEELLKAIRMIGSQRKLAKELGITRGAINNWLNRGTAVPIDKAMMIEVLANGNLKAEALAPYAKLQILYFKKYLINKNL
jgi:DNA-binding transcriptional regulator YdaS (Cro superfamily)